MVLIELTADGGKVRIASNGLDGVATFALKGGSAWLVENQADHFWNPRAPTARTQASRSASSKRPSASQHPLR